MSLAGKERSEECTDTYRALRSLKGRAALLFTNFLLIIMALYVLKPASRSLFIESLGADRLPYVWIGTALIMAGGIVWYHRLVERYDRFRIVLRTALLTAGLLLLFRVLLIRPSGAVAAGFYIFVDIMSVVLVEQCWCLANSIYDTAEGRRWYGVVGTGGLVGGVAGGALSAVLIKHTATRTPDLLLVAAVIIALIYGLTWLMGHVGIYCEVLKVVPGGNAAGGWRLLAHSRYLILIAAILLLAQLASPVIEYQFLKTVAASYAGIEPRTAFLSMFYSVMGIVSIVVNLGITPLIHRGLGVVAGLLVQPVVMAVCSWGFMLQPTLLMGGAVKISDRGLSYSINRASKELLYVPVDPVVIYQAKAWIDMFGYRMFKVLSSVVILTLTQWLPFKVGVPHLSWVTLTICAFWVGLVLFLKYDYVAFAEQSS